MNHNGTLLVLVQDGEMIDHQQPSTAYPMILERRALMRKCTTITQGEACSDWKFGTGRERESMCWGIMERMD